MPKKKSPSNDEMLGRIEAKLDIFKESFDTHVQTVNTKFEKLDDRQDVTNVILGKQQVILDDHVRRSNNLEEKMEMDKREVERKFEDEKKIIETQLAPIKEHVAEVKTAFKVGKWALKIAGALLATGGGAFGIKELIAIFTN